MHPMSRRLTFDSEPEKFVNAASYLAQRCPDLTKINLCKLLYLADTQHLLTYGRPIIGDLYIKDGSWPSSVAGIQLTKAR